MSDPFPYFAHPSNSPSTTRTPGIVNANTVPATALRQTMVSHGARNSAHTRGISEIICFSAAGAGMELNKSASATTHNVSSITVSTPSFVASRRSRRAGSVKSRLSVRPVYSCPMESAPRATEPTRYAMIASGPKRYGAFVTPITRMHATQASHGIASARTSFEITGGSIAATLMRWPCSARALRRKSLRASATRSSACPETALLGETSRRRHCH